MIEVKNLSKRFGETQVFQNLSFSVSDGEHVELVAPSGGGKTTLLRILCNLEKADEGTVEGLSPKDISYQFQEPRLFPTLTALQNVTCVTENPKEAEEEATELLRRLGLEDALQKLPSELSGGMKQRVSLARALLSPRPVLFLDEPFTALDPERKESVRSLVKEKSRGKTLLLVSHDPADGETLTSRKLILP